MQPRKDNLQCNATCIVNTIFLANPDDISRGI